MSSPMSNTLLSSGSTTSVEELSKIPHPENLSGNSDREIITSYSGFDDWLSTFIPSGTNVQSMPSHTPRLTEIEDTSTAERPQQLKFLEPSATQLGVLGYVDLKITRLRKKVGSDEVSDQEVVLPHLSWATSLVKLNQIVQELGASIPFL